MAVSELLRGVGGALAGLLTVVILAFSLAETRELLGNRERGIQWVAPRSHSAAFAPLWQPILLSGLAVAFCGYTMGVRLTSRRAVQFAAVGMAVGLLVVLALPSPLPEKYGTAGRNTLLFVLVVGVFLGGCLGTLVEGRWNRRPRGRWD
jgi:hypothetical protein